jgi:hypothetical protein
MTKIVATGEGTMLRVATMTVGILLLLTLSVLAGCDYLDRRDYRVGSTAVVGRNSADYLSMLCIVESAPVPMAMITNDVSLCWTEYGKKGAMSPYDIRCFVSAVSNTVDVRLVKFNSGFPGPPSAEFRSIDAHICKECQRTFSNRFAVIDR